MNEELLNKAKEYLYNEKFKEAEEYFKQVIEHDEYNLEANFYLGHIYQLKKDLKEAKKLFDKVIDKSEKILNDKEDVEVRYFLAAAVGAKALQEFNPIVALRLRNRFFTEIDKVLELEPNHPDALWLKGRAKALIGSFNEAEELLNKSLKLKENVLIYVDLALINLQSGKFEEAEKYLLKAKELNPTSPTVSYNLSLVYKATKDKEKEKQYREEFEKLI